MKHYIQKLFLVIIAISVGFIVYYYIPIASVILENLDFKNKLSLEDAEAIISETTVDPLYSWYSIQGITPVIEVMGEYEGRTGESTIQAFSGEILNSDIIEYAQQHPLDLVPNPGIEESLYQKLITVFPTFELIDSSIVTENDAVLVNLYLWVDNHYTQVVFDQNSSEILEIHEKYWKTKNSSLSQNEDVTPPVITITYPTPNMVVPHSTNLLDVVATAKDNTDSSPTIIGTGTYTLQDGFNKIIVVAIDDHQNASSKFIIVERLTE